MFRTNYATTPALPEVPGDTAEPAYHQMTLGATVFDVVMD